MKCTVNIANRSCYLPLRDAVLCADCEFISSDRGDTCAVCGGINLLKVCDVLGLPAASLQTAQSDLPLMMLTVGCEASPENPVFRAFNGGKGGKHV